MLGKPLVVHFYVVGIVQCLQCFVLSHLLIAPICNTEKLPIIPVMLCTRKLVALTLWIGVIRITQQNIKSTSMYITTKQISNVVTFQVVMSINFQ